MSNRYDEFDAADDARVDAAARVYYLRPGLPAEERRIMGDIRTLHDLIGGSLEQSSLGWDASGGLSILSDADSHRKNLAFNFRFENVVIRGNALLCRYNAAGDLVDVTDADIAIFQEHLRRR